MKHIKRLFTVILLLPVLALTSCQTGSPIAGVVANYGTYRYLSQAKTPAEWTKRHDQLLLAANDVELLNSTGLSGPALAAIASRFTSNPDVVFLISLVSAYAPATGAGAPNNALVTQITSGVKAALVVPSPFPPV